jgi:hypothetical protein
MPVRQQHNVKKDIAIRPKGLEHNSPLRVVAHESGPGWCSLTTW